MKDTQKGYSNFCLGFRPGAWHVFCTALLLCLFASSTALAQPPKAIPKGMEKMKEVKGVETAGEKVAPKVPKELKGVPHPDQKSVETFAGEKILELEAEKLRFFTPKKVGVTQQALTQEEAVAEGEPGEALTSLLPEARDETSNVFAGGWGSSEVNLRSGESNLTIPLGLRYLVRGGKLDLGPINLRYNSSIWQLVSYVGRVSGLISSEEVDIKFATLKDYYNVPYRLPPEEFFGRGGRFSQGWQLHHGILYHAAFIFKRDQKGILDRLSTLCPEIYRFQMLVYEDPNGNKIRFYPPTYFPELRGHDELKDSWISEDYTRAQRISDNYWKLYFPNGEIQYFKVMAGVNGPTAEDEERGRLETDSFTSWLVSGRGMYMEEGIDYDRLCQPWQEPWQRLMENDNIHPFHEIANSGIHSLQISYPVTIADRYGHGIRLDYEEIVHPISFFYDYYGRNNYAHAETWPTFPFHFLKKISKYPAGVSITDAQPELEADTELIASFQWQRVRGFPEPEFPNPKLLTAKFKGPQGKWLRYSFDYTTREIELPPGFSHTDTWGGGGWKMGSRRELLSQITFCSEGTDGPPCYSYKFGYNNSLELTNIEWPDADPQTGRGIEIFSYVNAGNHTLYPAIPMNRIEDRKVLPLNWYPGTEETWAGWGMARRVEHRALVNPQGDDPRWTYSSSFSNIREEGKKDDWIKVVTPTGTSEKYTFNKLLEEYVVKQFDEHSFAGMLIKTDRNDRQQDQPRETEELSYKQHEVVKSKVVDVPEWFLTFYAQGVTGMVPFVHDAYVAENGEVEVIWTWPLHNDYVTLNRNVAEKWTRYHEDNSSYVEERTNIGPLGFTNSSEIFAVDYIGGYSNSSPLIIKRTFAEPTDVDIRNWILPQPKKIYHEIAMGGGENPVPIESEVDISERNFWQGFEYNDKGDLTETTQWTPESSITQSYTYYEEGADRGHIASASISKGSSLGSMNEPGDGQTIFQAALIPRQSAQVKTDTMARIVKKAKGLVKKVGGWVGIKIPKEVELSVELAPSPETFEARYTYQNGVLKSACWGGVADYCAFDRMIDPMGAVLSETDPNGISKFYEYDNLSRLTSVTYRDARGELVRKAVTTYGPGFGEVITVVFGADYTVLESTSSKEDGTGRIIQECHLMPGQIWSCRDHKYDDLGRETSASVWHDPATTDAPHYTYIYDPRGRLAGMTEPNGMVSVYEYKGVTSLTTRKTMGLFRQATPAITTTDTFDLLGRKIKTVPPSVAGQEALPIFFHYDFFDQLWKVNQGSQKRTFLYDPMGRLKKVCLPETEGKCSEFEYDALGRREIERDPLGNLATYYRDEMGRTRGLEVNGSLVRINAYDQGLNAKGKLTVAREINCPDKQKYPWLDPTCRTISKGYSYDALGRIKEQHTDIWEEGQPSPTTFKLGFTYNLNDLIDGISYPGEDSGRITYKMDVGYPKEILMEGSTTPLVSVGEYNPAGGPKTLRFLNNVETEISYDSLFRQQRFFVTKKPAGISAMASMIPIWDSGNYSYYGMEGRIDAIGSSTLGTSTFSYDPRGRLISADLNYAPNLPSRRLEYSYDVYGNITAKKDQGQVTAIENDPATNRILRMTPLPRVISGAVGYYTVNQPNILYTHDANGNMVGDGTSDYAYDPFNRKIGDFPVLQEGQGTTSCATRHSYDASGLRVIKETCEGKTYYIYGPSGLLYSTIFAGRDGISRSEDYIYLGTNLVAIRKSGTPEEILFVNTDHLGSVRRVTDQQAAVVGRYDYSPFGEDISPANQFPIAVKFAGHIQDEAGINYMKGRFQSPGVLRFTTADPVSDMSFNKELNLYAYVNNDPVNYFDPTGAEPKKAGQQQPKQVQPSRVPGGSQLAVGVPEAGAPADDLPAQLSSTGAGQQQPAGSIYQPGNPPLAELGQEAISALIQTPQMKQYFKNLAGKLLERGYTIGKIGFKITVDPEGRPEIVIIGEPSVRFKGREYPEKTKEFLNSIERRIKTVPFPQTKEGGATEMSIFF